MNDKIEINGKNYFIETQTEGKDTIISNIYEGASKHNHLISHKQKVDTKTIKSSQLKNIHQNILSIFFKVIQKYSKANKEVLENEFLNTLNYTPQTKSPSSVISNNTSPHWYNLCKTYFPKSAYASFVIESGSISKYTKKNYIQDNDTEIILSLNKFYALNRKKIKSLIGDLKMLTITIESKQYFFFAIDNKNIIVTIVMPMEKLGIYTKEVEKFKSHFLK